MQLRLLKNTTAPKKSAEYSIIYARAIANKMEVPIEKQDKEWLNKTVYLLIKGMPILKKHGFKENRSENDVNVLFGFMQYAENLISQLTPRELTQIFPITKYYGGDRNGDKDYFFTIRVMEKMGMDIPIGEKVFELFYDYQNKHITKFALLKMDVIDDLRKLQGQPGMMESFMEKQGLTVLKKMVDENGKEFMFDPVKHTTIPIVKSYPRYLKLL